MNRGKRASCLMSPCIAFVFGVWPFTWGSSSSALAWEQLAATVSPQMWRRHSRHKANSQIDGGGVSRSARLNSDQLKPLSVLVLI